MLGPPPFSLADVRRAIPPHCFERSALHSSLYLVMDLALVLALALLLTYVAVPFAAQLSVLAPINFASVIRALPWLAYWVVQGSVMVGLWIVGHECGHGAFSSHQRLNDVVGWVIHSALLVPYFAWQMSHRMHHAHTGSLEDDHAFTPVIAPAVSVDGAQQHSTKQQQQQPPSTPPTRRPSSQPSSFSSSSSSSGSQSYSSGSSSSKVWAWRGVQRCRESVHNVLLVTLMLMVGMPYYLLSSAGGPWSSRSLHWWNVSHFNPNSAHFLSIPNAPRLIVLSNCGVALSLSASALAAWRYGAMTVLCYYGVPYCVMNTWVVCITWLHHTDSDLPRYDRTQWAWLEGALSTIDRSYGVVLDVLFHHIQDTHVLHHLFSTIPHYHAVEATKAIRKVLGPYYNYSDAPLLDVLMHEAPRFLRMEPHKRREGVYVMVQHSAKHLTG